MTTNNIRFNSRSYPCKVWHPSDRSIGACSFDIETTLIQRGLVPDFILGTAFNGEIVYFIQKNYLSSFLKYGASETIFMANCAFDISVSEKICGPLHNLLDENRVLDILLLRQLVRISQEGFQGKPPNLDELTQEYLEIDLPKDSLSIDGQVIRTSFGRFLSKELTITYSEIPWEYLEYAAFDAIATFKVAEAMVLIAKEISLAAGVDERAMLSQFLQAKAAYALNSLSRNGMLIDSSRLSNVKLALNADIERQRENLISLGWERPSDGPTNELRAILEQIDSANQIGIERTDGGRISASVESWEDHSRIPFISELLQYFKNKKLLQFLHFKEDRIHPGFGTIVSTGRTCSFGPNVQNMPRDSRVRSIFIPTAGHVFLDVDYSQIELRTLAQITYRKFGYSRMRDLLNDGVDLHRYFASKITGKDIGEVTNEDRAKAKAANFGFPGGLGLQSFIQYASSKYKITLGDEEALRLKEAWLETFPEIKEYLEFDENELIKKTGVLEDYPGFGDENAAVWALRRIICGEQVTASTQREYTEDEIEWAFQIIEKSEFPNKLKYEGAIRKRRGLWQLWRAFSLSLCQLTYESGRVQSNVGYSDSKNNPFQGLAADGAKEALYELVKSGHRVVNFIHDEYLVEVPLSGDLRSVRDEINEILISTMSKHCPDVRIEVESEWMDCWRKNGNLVLNENGLLIPKEN